MNEIFRQRVNAYFKDDAEKYLDLISKPCTQGFFLNTTKASKQQILDLIDFPYSSSDLTEYSFYHSSDGIGKTKVYELGLIYPQEIAASIPSTKIDTKGVKLVVDLCSAPGGKTINVLNKISKDSICICNDVSYKRALTLSSNLERLGLDNVVITSKDTKELSYQLENYADLVILDAPCSGEGMIRKYPEILYDYSINNINNLASIQKELLEDAYRILKCGGQLLYSTCTYAFEEDENQIIQFLNNHEDMEIIDLGNSYSSTLKGTIKLSPLTNTEGQFICLMRKTRGLSHSINLLKPIKEKIVDDFISDNLNIDKYYLYKIDNRYYMSIIPLPDLKNKIIRNGIYVGDIINKRFEPNHNFYRSNSLISKYKYSYDLSNEEYDKFISGNEIRVNLENHYYQLTYSGLSLGFGKCSNKQLKNKYPKGLRIHN
ncbi:MAG: hypothetical protein Q4E33_00935 [Erysipelotrichaceae bacterium]|nr:hypothetical protein [Erysipelotrichaceae bacterium]